MPTRSERIAGGLVGMLVGDALGVPYEFHRPEEIPPREQIEFRPPGGYMRSHGRVPPGTWSDDGAHALCLLASLLECGQFDVGDFASRLIDWYDDGYMAVDNVVFDVGIQTTHAIIDLKKGIPPLEAGRRDEQANGNGSLMRLLPLALWHKGSDEELARDACLQSRITHGHARSQVCCALYVLWARYTLEERTAPWADAVARIGSLYGTDDPLRQELEFNVRPHSPEPGKGSGYVVDCLRSARDVVLREADYEGVVKAAVALGDDTDTTACVAGGIAGIRAGLEGIPQRWRDGLRGRELYEPLLARLLARG